MTLPRCILFDCMNTLIGVHDQESYWTDLGRHGVQAGLFTSVEAFEEAYVADLAARRRDPTFREATLVDRLLSLSCVTADLPDDEKVAVADEISERFAMQYLEKSCVLSGVGEMLDAWRAHVKIGVVSDFFTSGLPRRLLERHRLLDKVNVVVDSCEVGWRKPNRRIYLAAFKELTVGPNQASDVLFIGDNPVCDVAGPRDLGMKALWYGRGNTECDVSDWRTFRPATYATYHDATAS